MRKLALVSALVTVAGCAPPEESRFSSGGSDSTAPSKTISAAPLMSFRPVVGGHLTLGAEGMLVIADAEHDRLVWFDPSQSLQRGTLNLGAGSWPTRVVMHEQVYDVLLRGTGELVRVEGRGVTWRARVCAEPRALTWDAAARESVVGCAGGEVVRLDAAGHVTSTLETGVEWRDLQVHGSALVGTSFRDARVATVFDDGAPLYSQPVVMGGLSPSGSTSRSQVAWRYVDTGAGGFMVHQLHADDLGSFGDPPATGTGSPPGSGVPSYYGAPTPVTQAPVGAVVTGISHVDDKGQVDFTAVVHDVLPVDAAASPDGQLLAVVGAGGSGLSVYRLGSLRGTLAPQPVASVTGLSLTSVVWTSPSELYVLEALRSTPLRFQLVDSTLSTMESSPSSGSVAHALFHQAPTGGAPISCASCHPEGGDDGHVWKMDGNLRRTQPLSGHVMARAPFHWAGNIPDLSTVMSETFVKRMGGASVDDVTVHTLGSWLDGIPGARASVVLSDEEKAVGAAAFTRAGCDTCHLASGRKGGLATVDGEALRSPPLQGVAARGPWLHDGSLKDLDAAILDDTLGHGKLSALELGSRQALLRYLRSL